MGVSDDTRSLFTTCSREYIFNVSHSGLYRIWLGDYAQGEILLICDQIPIGAWISGVMKIMYDRELAISERRVKPGDIIHNASLILGKQIVHILPEG